MIKSWFTQLLRRVFVGQSPVLQSSGLTRLSLDAASEQYNQALDGLDDDPQMLLSMLLARDQVEDALRQTKPLSGDQAQQLVALDAQLREKAAQVSLNDLSTWRQTICPPDTHWWWFLDQAAERREAEKGRPLVFLSGLFWAGAIWCALDIVKRLWDGAPDTFSVFGTLLTLFLASGSWTKRGRESAQWFLNLVLKHVPLLKRRVVSTGIATMAFIVFMLMLTGRLLLLPQLAEYYNDRGYDDLRAGNVAAAQRNFQRAVALDADMAVGYYHLGNVYEEIARPDEAIAWYQRALEHDLDLTAVYNNLGRLYIIQDDPELAAAVLRAGLRHTTGGTELELVTRYHLLSNLGWAYYVLEQPTRAREVLEQAITLESELHTAFKSAVPHYYLALTYEVLNLPDAALQQWEDSLRYLDSDESAQDGWDEVIRAHLDKLRE
jgi:tetratricopeptide (TPR) repeat protein